MASHSAWVARGRGGKLLYLGRDFDIVFVGKDAAMC